MSVATAPDPIVRVNWRRFGVPFRAEFRAAHGTMTSREGFLIEVVSASGAHGTGEASPLPSFAGGSLAETAVVLETLARAALGKAAGDAWKSCSAVPGVAPGSLAAARCGIETAIASLAARQEGVAFGAWLAATAGLPYDHSHLTAPVNAVIDMDTVDGVRDAVRSAIASGFTTVKLKVGGDPLADATRIAAAREAGGRAIELRADANRAWSEAEAREFFADVEPFNLSLCEEPLAPVPDHYRQLARLRRLTQIPLGIDESCSSSEQLVRALAAGAADVVVIKPMVTGLTEALAMLRTAAEHPVPVIVTTTFDTGVGTAVAAHLASLLPPPVLACGLATLDHLEQPLVVDPPIISDGMMRVPLGPGLGVGVDFDAIERYATGPATEVVV